MKTLATSFSDRLEASGFVGRQRWPELRSRLEAGHADRERPAPAVAGERPPKTPPAAANESAPLPEEEEATTAKEVLEHGDPVRYFLDAFEAEHVGDTTLAHCLVMSIASQAVRNVKGLHVYVTGESGKGKSSGMTAMLRQVPEECRLAERMSNKALYYSDDINPGTVLLLDDIALSEELQEILKEATSKFTEPVRMRTVDTDRKVRRYTVPERCAWWLANVSALYDDQVLNRMLVCWVDDSEVQDREVFARRMNAVAAGDDDSAADRFDLAVCRECWRLLRSDGPVTVRIPFAGRIRMASVRNRRNHEVLLDLVRAHALVFRFQRGHLPLEDGGLAVVATEEDFDYARRLFADLHGSGGSLGSRFDRNEEHILSIASRNHAGQFTIGDLQQWTGWTYQKARRLLVGRDDKGRHYPGLLDKSPALTLIDRTTASVDDDGRDVRQRQLVFAFDEEVNRETRASGLVWLEDEPSLCHTPCRGTTVATPVATCDECRTVPDSKNAREGEEIDPACCHNLDHTGTACASEESSPEDSASGSVATSFHDISYYKVKGGSDGETRRFDVATDVATAVPQRDCGNTIDPHAFVATDGPEWEKCSVCGRKPSHYRERSSAGSADPRRLCRRCYGRAVGRERAKVAPLAGTVDLSAMQRVGAAVGRCSHCDLAPAAWAGGGVRLCEGCYEREVRRTVEAGIDVMASSHG